MEENQGFLKKVISKVFGKNKYKKLPPGKEEINYSKENELVDEKDEFKKRMAYNSNISNERKDIKEEIKGEIEEEIDSNSIENFYFPANLDGYTFISDVVIDQNSENGSYVCYMVDSEKIDIEEGLPLCSVKNKDKLKIVENYLNEIKENNGKYNKESIKDIIENGFLLDNGERFSVTENYHLQSVLEGMLNAKEENEMIEIPIYYLCKPVKGYKIEKSLRRKTIEETDYDSIIKKFIIKGQKIDFDDMYEEQIANLKERYMEMINDLESLNNIDEYYEFGIEYAKNTSTFNPKCTQILKTYNEVHNQLMAELKIADKKEKQIRKLNLDSVEEKLKVLVCDFLLTEFNKKKKVFDFQKSKEDRTEQIDK